MLCQGALQGQEQSRNDHWLINYDDGIHNPPTTVEPSDHHTHTRPVIGVKSRPPPGPSKNRNGSRTFRSLESCGHLNWRINIQFVSNERTMVLYRIILTAIIDVQCRSGLSVRCLQHDVSGNKTDWWYNTQHAGKVMFEWRILSGTRNSA